MDPLVEKGLVAIVLAVIGMTIKWIGYLLNISGDKDKTSISKIELLKSTLQIENSLHINEYKIIYEESFSLIYKKPLHFNEIKELLTTRSPKMAILKFLDASPYIGVKDAGGFEYKKHNRIRIFNIPIIFPMYRGILTTLYVVLLMGGLIVFSKLTNNPETLITISGNLFIDSINFIGIVLACAIFIILGIKCLMKALIIPFKSELEKVLGEVQNKELILKTSHVIILTALFFSYFIIKYCW